MLNLSSVDSVVAAAVPCVGSCNLKGSPGSRHDDDDDDADDDADDVVSFDGKIRSVVESISGSVGVIFASVVTMAAGVIGAATVLDVVDDSTMLRSVSVVLSHSI